MTAPAGGMYYWNRDNFAGLAALAAALRADALLEPLARYCELREKGLRREAFAELDVFVAAAGRWDTATQRSAVLHILAAHWRTPDAHQFLAKPLRSRFVEPVLEQWRRDEPDNPVPLSELALLGAEGDLLREAHRLNPRDDRVRAALAALLVRQVEHATHHLVEGVFIGDERDAAAALVEANEFLAGMSAASLAAPLQQEAEQLRALLADWEEYRVTPVGTFPEWCRRKDRQHRWWGIVYYDG